VIEQAVLLSTGDELTSGRVVDSNSAYIAGRLYTLGVRVAAVLKVGDDKDKLLWALGQAREMGNIVIGTGGLGPTADDLTTAIVARFLGVELVEDKHVLADLKGRGERHGIPWTSNAGKQTVFPAGATIIPNPVGSALGFNVEMGEGKRLFWLSGVPHEMAIMLNQTVLPWIVNRVVSEEIHEAVFKIHGLTEAQLDELVKPLELDRSTKLSFRAHFPDLTLRLTTIGGALEREHFVSLREQISALLRDFTYAQSDVTLEEVVGALLNQKRLTLALAESCTGGLIAHRITRVPGSSAYFVGGSVSYSNQEKIRALGVSPITLERYGAVSRETALEMSRGILERAGADIALSITGIAGPSGGSPEKPVGTVWASIASSQRHDAKLLRLLVSERERIIQGTSQAALNWLRQSLLEL